MNSSQIPYRSFNDENSPPLKVSDLSNDSNVSCDVIDNLPNDDILKKIYFYHYRRGYWSIVISEISSLFVLLSVLFFWLMITSWICYDKIYQTNFGSLDQRPLTNYIDISFNRLTWWVIIPSIALLILFGIKFLALIKDIKDLKIIRNYYQDILGLDETSVKTIDWNEIVRRLLLRMGPDQTEFTLAARILRKENYILAMFNREILDVWRSDSRKNFTINLDNPLFSGDSHSHRENSSTRDLLIPTFIRRSWSSYTYTKTLEWALSYSLWNFLFINETGIINTSIFKAVNRPQIVKLLKIRMILSGVFGLILSPIITLYLLIYYMCSYFDQIRETPKWLGGRMWSPYALEKFREFNEYPHLFDQRMLLSRKPANNYVSTFPNNLLLVICRAVSFLLAVFLLPILIMGLVNESALVSLTVYGRSLISIATLLGIGLSLLSSLTQSLKETSLDEAQKYLDEVSTHVHYRPKMWQSATSESAQNEVKNLFTFRISIFIWSLLGIILTPIWLTLVYPKRINEILDFLVRFTISNNETGPICALSDFQKLNQHGNSKYCVGLNNPKSQVTRHGKLEKSIVTFAQNHPTWRYPEPCAQFLSTLENYCADCQEYPNGMTSFHIALSEFGNKSEKLDP